MDFKLSRESVSVNEVIYDGVSEQSVEVDYILPDYYPDIFKILKCSLTPMVVSYNSSGNKLNYDVAVQIKVLYVSQQDNCIKCIDQKYTYSKTVDLNGDCENAAVMIQPKVDYCNCRAVNERRLDIRAAVSCKITVKKTNYTEMVNNAEGMGIQLQKNSMKCIGESVNKNKQFVVREDVEVGASKPAIESILRQNAVPTETEYKVIANKVIVKSKIKLSALYSSGDNLEETETLIPVSQIVDFAGISEEYQCIMNIRVQLCELTPIKGSDGESHSMSCEMIIGIDCAAYKESEISLITDIYSTLYECESEIKPIKLEMMPQCAEKDFTVKSQIESGEEISSVKSAWTSINDISTRINENNELMIYGTLNVSVLANDADNNALMLDKSEVFEHTIPFDILSSNAVVSIEAMILSTSYTMQSGKQVDVSSDVYVKICVNNTMELKAAYNITVDDSKAKENDNTYALKVYYADPGESVWKIAKKYNTSINAIINENDIEDEVISERKMLLIPITE